MSRRVIQNPRLDDTVEWMARFANKDKDSAEVRGRVEKICRFLVQGDYASEALACYYWVCQHIRYMKDPSNVEMVKDPIRVLETKAGDCDDIATLLSSMLMACGNEACFSMVGFVAGAGPSHVYACVYAHGKWVALDPVANREIPDMLRRTKVRKNIPVSARAGQLKPPDAAGLSGMNLGSSPTIYSVFDYRTGLYTYYTPAKAPRLPASGVMRPARGLAPEGLAVLLPEGARKTGTGTAAKGVIAARPSEASLGSSDGTSSKTVWAVGALLALGGLWAATRPARPRRKRAA